ncbi:MAG: DUF934 domain-containing protein [Moraxella sp.]|nr:DUF934 domain-containing protein [Moraxella sp.]
MIIHIHNNDIVQSSDDVYLYHANEVPLIDNIKKTDDITQAGIVLVSYDDFMQLSDTQKTTVYLLLTADDIGRHLELSHLNGIVIYITDFKDGRVFSLVRHIRQVSDVNIIIAGEFGIDQAAYFYKSGANGFIIDDNQIETIKNTLNDLKTAHFGQSASSLPMFR